MNTTMIFSYIKYVCNEKALFDKQGLVSVYTFLRERNHVIPENSEMDKRL